MICYTRFNCIITMDTVCIIVTYYRWIKCISCMYVLKHRTLAVINMFKCVIYHLKRTVLWTVWWNKTSNVLLKGMWVKQKNKLEEFAFIKLVYSKESYVSDSQAVHKSLSKHKLARYSMNVKSELIFKENNWTWDSNYCLMLYYTSRHLLYL